MLIYHNNASHVCMCVMKLYQLFYISLLLYVIFTFLDSIITS